VIVLLADCGPSVARAPKRSTRVDPPANTSPVKSSPPDPVKVDPEELSLLEAATGGELGPLAEYYLARGAFDEYSAVKSRMLENVTPGPGPVPGGPFPRIGAPRTTPRPKTFLGTWINPTDLPELFEKVEVTPRDLEKRLRAELARDPKSATVLRRLGDTLCAQLRFADDEVLYRASGDRRARERLADVMRVLTQP
jgi:hypothetical protein